MTIEQIGIMLTILVTILGWGVTAYYQRQILERQLEAERQREVRQAIVPRKLQELERIRAWFEEGARMLFTLFNWRTEGDVPATEHATLSEQLRQWNVDFEVLYEIAQQHDKSLSGKHDLAGLMMRFQDSMPRLPLKHNTDGGELDGGIYTFSQVFPAALIQLDSLVKQVTGHTEQKFRNS